jgi:phosphonoacetaldehyde hydrolase
VHDGTTVWQLRLVGARARNAARPERLHALVGDWSGTFADNWVTSVSCAVADVWREFGVPITMDEAREPMGLSKELHLKRISEMPRVAAAWRSARGRDITEADIKQMFRSFVPRQLARLREPAVNALIPGTLQAVAAFRRQGLKIGMTTGFQRVFVDVLSQAAARQGFVPDVNLAADDVERPRPFPDMVVANATRLKAPHIHAILKVLPTNLNLLLLATRQCLTRF